MRIQISENQAEPRTDILQICLWKRVLLNNLDGEGTSFDPVDLTVSVTRCLYCDGSDGECCLYVS